MTRRERLHDARHRGARGALVAVLLGGIAVEVPAQEPVPAFPAEAKVVLLDLVVRDAKGRPVADLRQDELAIFEDGAPCEVVSFRLVREAERVASAEASAAEPRPTTRAHTDERPNLVVLVFDQLSVTTAPAARHGALEFLSRSFPQNTWFAVFKIDRHVQALAPFTADPMQLESAVQRATFSDALTDEPAAGTPLPQALPEFTGAARAGGVAAGVGALLQELARRVEAFDSLYALQAIARSLDEVRGRKTIVYFAEHRQLPPATEAAYDTAVSEANRANVTIHTIDARGLSAHRSFARSSFDELLARLSAEDPTQVFAERPLPGTEMPKNEYQDAVAAMSDMVDAMMPRPLGGSVLEHLARDTGGLAIADTNDLGLGLGRVAEELAQYYEAVYIPPRPEPDGRFRRIRARVSRPGLSVRTRAGYFANLSTSATMLAYELPLLAALESASPPRSFAHQSAALHFGANGHDRQVLFVTQAALSEIQLTPDPAGKRYRGHLTFVGLVKDESGRTVTRLSHHWPLEGPLVQGAAPRGALAVFRRSGTLPAGRYSLATALQDQETGAISVVHTPFEVPPPTSGPVLSSVVIVRHASAVDDGTASRDPLGTEGVLIAPSLGRVSLPAARAELPYFIAVFPAPGAEAPVVTLELRRGSQILARAAPPVPAADPTGRIVLLGSIPLERYSPGDYELWVSARQGSSVAEEKAAFSVAPEPLERRARERGHGVADPEVSALLDKAGLYVREYEQSFRTLVAEETRTQSTEARRMMTGGLVPAQQRVTRADMVFVRLDGEIPWGTFRDVFEVDGQRVRDREVRLERLLRDTQSSARERMRALLAESARYNLGPGLRTYNIPTLPLAFLHPRNQGRFSFERGGRRRIAGIEGIEIKFEEVAFPTMVSGNRDAPGDLPARGSVWVDHRGTVLRTEVRFVVELSGFSALMATEYRPEPKLAMWVPAQMREECRDLPGASSFGALDATARYSNFRVFSITTEAQATLPQP